MLRGAPRWNRRAGEHRPPFATIPSAPCNGAPAPLHDGWIDAEFGGVVGRRACSSASRNVGPRRPGSPPVSRAGRRVPRRGRRAGWTWTSSPGRPPGRPARRVSRARRARVPGETSAPRCRARGGWRAGKVPRRARRAAAASAESARGSGSRAARGATEPGRPHAGPPTPARGPGARLARTAMSKACPCLSARGGHHRGADPRGPEKRPCRRRRRRRIGYVGWRGVPRRSSGAPLDDLTVDDSLLSEAALDQRASPEADPKNSNLLARFPDLSRFWARGPGGHRITSATPSRIAAGRLVNSEEAI